MKNIIALSVLAVVLVGCGKKEEAAPAAPAATPAVEAAPAPAEAPAAK